MLQEADLDEQWVLLFWSTGGIALGGCRASPEEENTAPSHFQNNICTHKDNTKKNTKERCFPTDFFKNTNYAKEVFEESYSPVANLHSNMTKYYCGLKNMRRITE